MKNNIFKIIGLLFFFISIVALVSVFGLVGKKDVKPPANEYPLEPNGEKSKTDTPGFEDYFEDNVEAGKTIDSNNNVDEVGEEKDIETGKKPSKNESSKNENTSKNTNVSTPKTDEFINDKSLISSWELLDEAAEAGQSFYSEYFSKTRIITKNGYLYNKASEEKIDVNYLVANGYLSSKFLNKGIEILLLNVDNFSNYDNFRLKQSEEGLTVFASIKHPSKNYYLLTTNKSTGGAISASQYAALLNSYYQNHGIVGRLYSDAEEYGRILNFISMYESKFENYYVRSITTDNKYAMVILSDQDVVSDLKQYILKRNGSVWEVVLSGLETDPRVIITVNKALPDFNLSMVPAYTINDHRTSISRDKSEIISILASKGHIKSSDEIKYICGTSNFCYIVLNNEVKFLCNNIGDGWNISQVASSDDAHRKMLAINKNAPTFIILDR